MRKYYKPKQDVVEKLRVYFEKIQKNDTKRTAPTNETNKCR